MALAFSSNPKLLFGSLKSSLELINASAGVNKLLLTGKEGMALGADINSQVAALGGLGLNDLAASTSDLAYFVLRMDSVFHFHVPLFKYLMFLDIGEPRPARQTVVLYHKEKENAIVFSKKIAFSQIFFQRMALSNISKQDEKQKSHYFNFIDALFFIKTDCHIYGHTS